MKKVCRETAEHYYWKEICDGWHFVNTDSLSIIAERMPPRTEEDRHFHHKAKQFFYILSGEAVMEFTDHSEILHPGMGVEVFPNEIHQMKNKSDTDVEFLVISTPKSHGDKALVSE